MRKELSGPCDRVNLVYVGEKAGKGLDEMKSGALDGDAYSAKMSMVDALKKACEEAYNTWVPFEKLTRLQKEMRLAHTKETHWFNKKHVEEVVV